MCGRAAPQGRALICVSASPCRVQVRLAAELVFSVLAVVGGFNNVIMHFRSWQETGSVTLYMRRHFAEFMSTWVTVRITVNCQWTCESAHIGGFAEFMTRAIRP